MDKGLETPIDTRVGTHIGTHVGTHTPDGQKFTGKEEIERLKGELSCCKELLANTQADLKASLESRLEFKTLSGVSPLSHYDPNVKQGAQPAQRHAAKKEVLQAKAKLFVHDTTNGDVSSIGIRCHSNVPQEPSGELVLAVSGFCHRDGVLQPCISSYIDGNLLNKSPNCCLCLLSKSPNGCKSLLQKTPDKIGSLLIVAPLMITYLEVHSRSRTSMNRLTNLV